MAETSPNQPVLIVGLGNPGKDYLQTRHSLGFLALDALAQKHNFPAFEMREDNTMASQGEISGKTVILAKPQTFMNKSGISVKRVSGHYRLFKDKKFGNLWVVNDDLDIAQGKIKIAKNRSAAGHKGVQSIIDQIKSKDFVRFRLGIHPETAAQKKIPVEKLVLKKISPKEQTNFAKTIDLAVSAIEAALAQGIEKAMTEFNQ